MQYLLLVLSCLIMACPGPICQKLQTRCARDAVEICDHRGRWHKVIDCRQIQPDGWDCVFDGQEHTCVEVIRHEASYNGNRSQPVVAYGNVVSFAPYKEKRFSYDEVGRPFFGWNWDS